MRSFSNLWFWIALAVMWSTTSHWVLGVPHDLINRARRKGGQAAVDVQLLTRVYIGRLLHIAEMAGLWIVAFVSCALTTLGTLGFLYDFEFAQALFCLAFPLSLVGLLSLRTARRIAGRDLQGDALYRTMARHRMMVQFIGMVSIFVTAMWGMYQNLHFGAL